MDGGKHLFDFRVRENEARGTKPWEDRTLRRNQGFTSEMRDNVSYNQEAQKITEEKIPVTRFEVEQAMEVFKEVIEEDRKGV